MSYAATTPTRLLSVDEYFAFEEASPVKHEYVGGELYAFAGSSRRHNRLAARVITALSTAAEGTECQILTSDMLLKAADNVYYYPDVTVVCDPEDVEERYVSQPCCVVEVLSPSTAAYDRREKLLLYRGIVSLQGCVLLWQDQVRAERHWRDQHGGWWHETILSGAVLSFPCPRLDIPVDLLYQGILPAPAER
jgi:Uma2 family endonuclease